MMFNFSKGLVTVAMTTLLLQGCGWNAYKVHEDKAQQNKAELDAQLELLFTSSSAEYIDSPPMYKKAKKIENKPGWLTTKNLSITTVRPQELSTVMSKVLESQSTVYPLYEGGTANTMVSLNVKNVSLDYVIRVIQAQADLHYEIRGKNIVWSDTETKTFSIAALPGTRTYGMGTDESSGDSGSQDSTSSSGNVKSGIKDYAKLKGEQLEFLSSIEKGVKEIAGPDGVVIVSESGTNLTVTAPPSKIRLVDKYVHQNNDDLNRQIVLMVKILTFQSNNSASAGIDWKLVKDSSYGKLSLGSAFTNSINSSSFLKFAPTSGGLSGSELLISALEKQGKVSVANELPVTLLNYRPSRFEYKDNQSYVANVVNNESTETNQTTTELEKDTASDGYTMFALGKILDDRVLLQLSSELQALKDFDVTSINEIEVKSPQYTQSLFAQTNSIKFGETLIANAFTQTNSNSETSSNFGNFLLGGNYGETKTLQTVVMITPLTM